MEPIGARDAAHSDHAAAEDDFGEGKMFIGGLSWQTTSEGLRAYFEAFGAIADVSLMMDKRTGKPRGFGFVTFVDPASVDLVLAQATHLVDGRSVDVKRAVPRDRAPMPAGRQESRKIFVGGLAPEVNEKEFNEYFSKFGALQDSIVMYDKATNRSRGFGFVTFESEEGVQAVLSSDHEIMGKWVEIKRAEPRDSSRGMAGDLLSGGGYGQQNGGFRSDAGGPAQRGQRGGRDGGYNNYTSGYGLPMPYMVGMGGRGDSGYGSSYGYGAPYGGRGTGGQYGGGQQYGGGGYGYSGTGMQQGSYYGSGGTTTGSYSGYGSTMGGATASFSGGYSGSSGQRASTIDAARDYSGADTSLSATDGRGDKGYGIDLVGALSDYSSASGYGSTTGQRNGSNSYYGRQSSGGRDGYGQSYRQGAPNRSDRAYHPY